MIECDFVVVGAGIAGSSAAYELSANGRVVVLEAEEQPGYHSTGRSAALFRESNGVRVARALASASRSFFENPPEGFAEVPLLSPRGAMIVAREDQRNALDAMLADARATRMPVAEMGPADAMRRVPVLAPTYVAKALLDDGAMDMDVAALLQGFLRGLKARGGTLVSDAPVESLERAQGSWTAHTRAGDFRAPVVVNAAGAWADQVAKSAGARPVGLQPRRRTAFIFRPQRGLDFARWPMVIDVGETFYFKPDAGRMLASPADETPVEPHDVRPDDMDIALGVERLKKATSFEIDHIDRSWAGLRSFVRDRTPVIGFASDAPGFFWLAGQGGFGIESAPAAARIAAALATGRALPADIAERNVSPADLAPDRLWRSP